MKDIQGDTVYSMQIELILAKPAKYLIRILPTKRCVQTLQKLINTPFPRLNDTPTPCPDTDNKKSCLEPENEPTNRATPPALNHGTQLHVSTPANGTTKRMKSKNIV
ncbi:hypothetical protein N7481_001824 [Penicillium waksmanii]|uniref:uncharacterized protein n=1 Tax=Penicillium waksmanii TaxID=69791 RepID=UPI00254770AB|nr:uncharacterized protein N7481_001824 [Penicillium waksmanii]KAJ5994847.1 hypothetical protein N7481_001824 [Penicillium waksmanii]